VPPLDPRLKPGPVIVVSGDVTKKGPISACKPEHILRHRHAIIFSPRSSVLVHNNPTSVLKLIIRPDEAFMYSGSPSAPSPIEPFTIKHLALFEWKISPKIERGEVWIVIALRTVRHALADDRHQMSV